jgi:hypothetical protein
VIATPASAIEPPAIEASDGSSPSQTRATRIATTGTAYREALRRAIGSRELANAQAKKPTADAPSASRATAQSASTRAWTSARGALPPSGRISSVPAHIAYAVTSNAL